MAFRLSSLLGRQERRQPDMTDGNAQLQATWRAGNADPVLRLAHEGEILAVNDGAQALLADEGGKLDGRSILDFVGREDRAAFRDALRHAIANGDEAQAVRFKCRVLRQKFGPIFAEFALRSEGDTVAVLLRDRGPEIAALRKPTAPFEPRHENQGTPTVEPVDNVKAKMLADLGHELKTPLNSIMGFAAAMRAETFGPLGHDKYEEYAGLIHAAGGHAADLIEAILDRAKLDAGRYELTPSLASPAPVARTCAEFLRPDAERAGLSLKVEIANDLPETMFDASALRRILINLLNNAVKFTADGSITLSVARQGDYVEFAVSDTGVGMSQHALERLGDRFTAQHKNGVRGATGTGLGLSMVHTLATLHGGALKLESAPGEGTEARFLLPIRQSLKEMRRTPLSPEKADIQSQLDRVAQYRRERLGRNAA